MMLTAYLGELLAQRDRLNAAITALEALQNGDPNPPARQNGNRHAPRGRQAPTKKPAGVSRPHKNGGGLKVTWDVKLAEKLWKAGAEVKEIAKRAGTKPDSIYERAARLGWGARQKRGKGKTLPARVDAPKRICEGCHQPTTTNPCHCGHIH